MIPLPAIESELDRFTPQRQPQAAAERLLALADEVLQQWVVARGEVPTWEQREGFRLLSLHHQGARGVPSFNACRESCREIAYHYNLIIGEPDSSLCAQRQRMMAMLTKHLLLFVSGKMQVEGLGEFCCASRPLRLEFQARESQTRESGSRESQANDASGRLPKNACSPVPSPLAGEGQGEGYDARAEESA